MTFTESVSTLAKATGHYLMPFGKAERLLAAMCMGIPPFLILAEEGEKIGSAMFVFVIVVTLVTPFVIAGVAEILRERNWPRLSSVLIILLVTGFMFAMYWWLVTDGGMTALRSVSIYVTMEDSYIFGVLLAVPSMLFAVNGIVFWTEPGKGWPTWRSFINVVMGISLLCVALIHCVRSREPHMVAAFTFFGCCALTCFGKDKSNWLAYLLSLLIMAGGGIILLGNMNGWFSFYPDLFTIFGAEAIALWVTGVNYIMISLERVPIRAVVPA